MPVAEERNGPRQLQNCEVCSYPTTGGINRTSTRRGESKLTKAGTGVSEGSAVATPRETGSQCSQWQTRRQGKGLWAARAPTVLETTTHGSRHKVCEADGKCQLGSATGDTLAHREGQQAPTDGTTRRLSSKDQ